MSNFFVSDERGTFASLVNGQVTLDPQVNKDMFALVLMTFLMNLTKPDREAIAEEVELQLRKFGGASYGGSLQGESGGDYGDA